MYISNILVPTTFILKTTKPILTKLVIPFRIPLNILLLRQKYITLSCREMCILFMFLVYRRALLTVGFDRCHRVPTIAVFGFLLSIMV